MMEGKPIEKVHVSVQDGEFGYRFEFENKPYGVEQLTSKTNRSLL